MLTMRISVAICATLLLVAAEHSGQFAHATSCLAGIKGLFCGHKSYAILADHLYRETQLAELADNTKAAGSLLSQRPDSGGEDLIGLVDAFGSLDGNSNDTKTFCTGNNLTKLRRVAEGLRDGGNLGPRKITKAIGRLNRIVVKVIEDARRVCDPYLTGKWPEPWEPKFSDPAMRDRIANLGGLASSYLYEGFTAPRGNPSTERISQLRTISTAIRNSELQAANSAGTNDGNPAISWDMDVIGDQFDEYVFKPCWEFVLSQEARHVLVPYNEMLKSWYVVSTGFLDKYYENKDAYKPHVKTGDFNENLSELAFMHEACRHLIAAPKWELVGKIAKRRQADYGP